MVRKYEGFCQLEAPPGGLVAFLRAMLALSVAFRRGLQWPFREGDTLRVYHPDGTLVAELPARFLLDLVHHHLTGLALQTRWADHLGPAPAPPRLPAAAGRRL